MLRCGCRDLDPRHELGKLACYQATPHPPLLGIILLVINFRIIAYVQSRSNFLSKVLMVSAAMVHMVNSSWNMEYGCIFS